MRQKTRLAMGLALIFAATLLLGGCGSADVGILDVNKVQTESPMVKKLQGQYSEKMKALSDKLVKDKATLSADEFQKQQGAAQDELMKLRQTLASQLDNSFKQAMEQVAKEKKLSVIIDKSAAPYGGVDVTDAVMQKMQ
jgi:outer membrane protein